MRLRRRHAILRASAGVLHGVVCAWLGSTSALAAQNSPACQSLSKTLDAEPAGPVFLASYPTVKEGPLQGVAFLYDNAVATIALVACGEPQKAKRIGDAMLIALDHDRYWHDGRLRNGYAAGPVPSGPVKLAGWWDTKQNQWVEDRYQVGSDNGNMAWAMLALLTLDQTADDRRYRDGAGRIAAWVAQWRDKRGAGGFTGGTFAFEPAPDSLKWKSTEHNTDLAAAFSWLAQASHDQTWLKPARSAAKFVGAMWTPRCACFAVGTGEDGRTRNVLLALDAQIWPLLALPQAASRYRVAVKSVESKLGQDGGFAYGATKQGLWTEGTAQTALLLALMGREAEANRLDKVVEGMRAPDGFYYAANAQALPTGFMLDTDPSQPRVYFHIPHLAALSWAALAARRFNPFTGTKALP
ncbi:MAG: hypothetical protein WCA81_17030 [Rhizomicrobium sp.]